MCSAAPGASEDPFADDGSNRPLDGDVVGNSRDELAVTEADGHSDASPPSDFEAVPAAPDDELERAYLQALQRVEAVESRQTTVWENFAAEPSHDQGGQSPPEETDGDAPAAGEETEVDNAVDGTRVTPRQIIEAALFVGGTPLTTKRLRSLLRDEFDQDFVESAIKELNRQYADECRPYEIVFGEGGYRLRLRSDFQSLRNRVFGLGPKEVKLSQEALEVLAVVAYRGPVTRCALEEAGKTNAGATLRHLVRRELIAIERTGENADEVAYRTTPRFLEVFGLKDLSELPQSDDDFSFK